VTRAALGFIVLFGFALRFRAADHPYISQWDEAYHALVAKNLASHPLTPTLYEDAALPVDGTNWTRAGVWLHKPPLPLWLMACSIASLGPNEFSIRLPSVVLDTLAILLIYLLAVELFGAASQVAGIVAAAAYALNPLMIRLVSGRIPDDAPHVINVFFITLTVLLFAVAARKNSRAYAAAAGFSMGLGTLCMSAVALLGLAAALPLLLQARGLRGSFNLLFVSFGAFLAAALPWPLYALNRWPELWRHETALQTGHLFTALDGHAHAWWWYLNILPVQYGGFMILAWTFMGASAAYAVLEAGRRRAPGLSAALIWLLLPYLFFSVIATKLYAYVSVAVPAACLLAGFAGAALWAARRGPRRMVVAAVLLAGAAQAGLVAAERVRADYATCPWNERYDYPSLRRAMIALARVPGPKAILNVGDGKAPQAMYYSGSSAYSDAPTVELVRGLLDRGYLVFVVLDEEKRGADIPPALKTSEFAKKVLYIPLPPPRGPYPKHPYEA
jgi:4-amino-4-deoxy-L-arabinose transferase-like glycosyltransferase